MPLICNNNQTQFGMFPQESHEDGDIYWAICALPSGQTDKDKVIQNLIDFGPLRPGVLILNRKLLQILFIHEIFILVTVADLGVPVYRTLSIYISMQNFLWSRNIFACMRYYAQVIHVTENYFFSGGHTFCPQMVIPIRKSLFSAMILFASSLSVEIQV